MTAKLNEDITSHLKKVLYGKKGETVTVTAQFQNVLIVKNDKGDKYPAPSHKVTILSEN